MKNKINIAFLLLSLCLTALPLKAHATFVVPKRVMIDQGRNSGVVTIMNRTDKAYSYTFDFEDRAQGPNGENLLLKEGETTPGFKSAKDMMIMSPRQVVVQPGQSQKIRIMARRPADLPEGEYHSHLLIKPQPLAAAKADQVTKNGLGGTVQVLAYVSIPIFIRTGKTKLDFNITDAQLVDAGERKAIRLAIDNNSTRSLYGRLEVECQNADGTIRKSDISALKMYGEAKRINQDVIIPKSVEPFDNCQKRTLNIYGMQDFEYPNKLIKSAPIR